MKLETLLEGKAFNKALAGESIPDSVKEKWDDRAKVFNGVTHKDLDDYAKNIADKVINNIENGHK